MRRLKGAPRPLVVKCSKPKFTENVKKKNICFFSGKLLCTVLYSIPVIVRDLAVVFFSGNIASVQFSISVVAIDTSYSIIIPFCLFLEKLLAHSSVFPWSLEFS